MFACACSTMSILIVLVLVSQKREHVNGKKMDNVSGHSKLNQKLQRTYPENPGYTRYFMRDRQAKPPSMPIIYQWWCYGLFVCAHWCVEWMRILLRLHWALTPHKTKWYQIIYQRKSTSAHKWTQVTLYQAILLACEQGVGSVYQQSLNNPLEFQRVCEFQFLDFSLLLGSSGFLASSHPGLRKTCHHGWSSHFVFSKVCYIYIYKYAFLYRFLPAGLA